MFQTLESTDQITDEQKAQLREIIERHVSGMRHMVDSTILAGMTDAEKKTANGIGQFILEQLGAPVRFEQQSGTSMVDAIKLVIKAMEVATAVLNDAIALREEVMSAIPGAEADIAIAEVIDGLPDEDEQHAEGRSRELPDRMMVGPGMLTEEWGRVPGQELQRVYDMLVNDNQSLNKQERQAAIMATEAGMQLAKGLVPVVRGVSGSNSRSAADSAKAGEILSLAMQCVAEMLGVSAKITPARVEALKASNASTAMPC